MNRVLLREEPYRTFPRAHRFVHVCSKEVDAGVENAEIRMEIEKQMRSARKTSCELYATDSKVNHSNTHQQW